MRGRFLRVALRILLALALACVLPALFMLALVLKGFAGDAILPADCALVFGAAVHPVFDTNGKITSYTSGPGIDRRVHTAVELFRKKLVSRIFMTGGKGEGNPKSEAEVMRDLAVREGVPVSRITLETASRSTEENIRNTKPLTGSCSSIVGISDGYHLARIRVLARAEGMQLSTFAAQGSPPAYFLAYSVFREVGALFMFTLSHL